MPESSIFSAERFGDLHISPPAIRSVASRIVATDHDRAVKRELAEMLGLLPHLHTTEPVVLNA